ncbi:hypothetical protein ACX818_001317 [Acinetobacter baumannii]
MLGLKNPFKQETTQIEVQKQFAAVHVITESTDHYNFLVEHVTALDIVDFIQTEMGDEFYYICDYFVTAEDFEIQEEAVRLFDDALSEE